MHECKTEGRSPEDISDYQNLIDLFIDLRDGNLNPREALRNQIDFKSITHKIFETNSSFLVKSWIYVF